MQLILTRSGKLTLLLTEMQSESSISYATEICYNPVVLGVIHTIYT